MKKIEEGCKVKIEDIGPLGTCIHNGMKYIEVELEGEIFLILKRLCHVAD